MKRVDSRSLYKVINNLGRMNQMYLDDNSDVNKDKAEDLSLPDKTTIRELFKEILENSTTVGANVTATAAQDVIKMLRKNVTYKEIGEEIKIVDEIFRKEIRSATIFSVSIELSNMLYKDGEQFGKQFNLNFPSAVFELDEACACLALGRDTASVFHLMRIMEIVLRSLNSCLGLPDPTGSDKNWENMLTAMKTQMNSRNQHANGGWQGKDKELFTELHASMDAVRAAWRNTTMHVEHRYNAEEANHLFVVVRQFAKKVASRMDETGQPLA